MQNKNGCSIIYKNICSKKQVSTSVAWEVTMEKRKDCEYTNENVKNEMEEIYCNAICKMVKGTKDVDLLIKIYTFIKHILKY